MKAYTVQLFERMPGTSVRKGMGKLTFAVGDDVNAVRYVEDTWPDNLKPPFCADLYDEDGKLIWESHPTDA